MQNLVCCQQDAFPQNVEKKKFAFELMVLSIGQLKRLQILLL